MTETDATEGELRDVAAALRDVLDQWPRTERRITAKLRRYMAGVLAVLVLSAGALAGAGVLYVRDNSRQACQSANEVRTGLLHFIDYLSTPQTPLPPDATADQVAAVARRDAARNAYIDEAHRDFKLLACG